MPRLNHKLLFITAALVPLVLGGCARFNGSNVRTFPDRCPSGWQFLYTNHDMARGGDRPKAVCRQEPDSVAKSAAH